MTVEPAYVRIYCGACATLITFPADGALAVRHANKHGYTLEYTEADGFYIAHPEPQHTPTPVITLDEVLDVHDMSDRTMLAFFRETMRAATS